MRAANDIVDVVGQVVHLKRQGANYFGLCPFHGEKTPSFSVSPAKQIYYCFGCHKGGNVISFVMEYEHCTFQEAVVSLSERAGIRLPEMQYSEEMRREEERRRTLLEINKEAAVYYYRLLRSPRGSTGMEYLSARKLTQETMQRFGLGYADGRNSDLVAYLRGKGFADDLIRDSGLAAFDEKRGLHDKFWNRVMFPIMDIRNRVIGFGGRVMGDGKPKYLNSPETVIFDKGRNLYAMNFAKQSRADHFILCEGYMDVISMHQAGFTQAVASLGTSFTDGQAQLLKRYAKEGNRYIILSYDSDAAGVNAALRNHGVLQRAGLRTKVLNLRPHKDPDEFIKAEGADAFTERLSQAENTFFFELRQMESRYDMKDPGGRTDFARAAAKMLGQFDDDLERENYIRSVAQKYFIDENTLRKMTASYTDAGQELPKIRQPLPTTRAGRESNGAGAGAPREDGALLQQQFLLTWLTEYPGAYPAVARFIRPEDFSEGLYRQAAEKIFGDLEAGRTPSPASVISMFTDGDEQAKAASLFEAKAEPEDENGKPLRTAEEREKALRDIVYRVKQASVARMTRAPGGGESPGSPGSGTDFLAKVIGGKKQLEEIRKTRFPAD